MLEFVSNISGWVSFVVFISAVPAFIHLKNYLPIIGWTVCAIFCLIWTLILRADRLSLSSGCCPCVTLRGTTDSSVVDRSTSRRLFMWFVAGIAICMFAFSTYMFLSAISNGERLNGQSHYLAGISSLASVKWIMYVWYRLRRIDSVQSGLGYAEL